MGRCVVKSKVLDPLEPCFLHIERGDGANFKLVGKTEVVKRPQEMGEQGYDT